MNEFKHLMIFPIKLDIGHLTPTRVAIKPQTFFPKQKRIMAMVDELMSLCDALEKQISITSTQSTRLLNAVLQGRPNGD